VFEIGESVDADDVSIKRRARTSKYEALFAELAAKRAAGDDSYLKLSPPDGNTTRLRSCIRQAASVRAQDEQGSRGMKLNIISGDDAIYIRLVPRTGNPEAPAPKRVAKPAAKRAAAKATKTTPKG